ncbi:SH3 domain-containing protein [Chlamydiia bacterium]|nr:SH3 domain-containing protein [Chlamydiia bacterium]
MLTLCSVVFSVNITDKMNIPQDHHFFSNNLRDESIKRRKLSAFTDAFFKPWDLNSITTTKDNVVEDFEYFHKRKFVGINLETIYHDYYDKLRIEADLHSFPNMYSNGISTRQTDIRIIPSDLPAYIVDSKHNSYPFDRIQESSLPANTPLKIIHRSKNNSWCFVQMPFLSGWVRSADIAFLSTKQTKDYNRHQTFIAITDIDIPTYFMNDQYKSQTGLGSVYPLIDQTDEHFIVQTFDHNIDGTIEPISIKIDKASAKPMPLELNPINIELIFNKLQHTPYSWGGKQQLTDCSEMIKKALTPFGFVLPRNSSDQFKHSGVNENIKHIEDKKTYINRNSKPYQTLIYMPGHIMLYIGQYNNEPVVFHNVWSLSTGHPNGHRISIGQALNSSLEPGKEQYVNDTYTGLLSSVVGLTHLE